MSRWWSHENEGISAKVFLQKVYCTKAIKTRFLKGRGGRLGGGNLSGNKEGNTDCLSSIANNAYHAFIS